MLLIRPIMQMQYLIISLHKPTKLLSNLLPNALKPLPQQSPRLRMTPLTHLLQHPEQYISIHYLGFF